MMIVDVMRESGMRGREREGAETERRSGQTLNPTELALTALPEASSHDSALRVLM